MQVKSTFRYARISAFKAREVTREIQGLPVSQALDVLTFSPKKAALMVGKTLKSAVANAENNHDLRVDRLVVQEAVVGEGPTIKRFATRARGSAGPIHKRTSHIRIILTDEIELPEPRKKAGSKSAKKAQGASRSRKPKQQPEVQAEAETAAEETAEQTGSETK
jgi:large subunit ribosomal protein L22